MVLRNIVKIDEEKCNGCGKCVQACAEGAIQIIDDKAKLISETYCDGLGACLGHCPQDAITVEQRDADEFDEQATGLASAPVPSQLSNWPVQLKLVSPTASYFANADLLLVADCVPFAIADFHNKFLKNHSIVIGCPKLDDSQFYIDKLTEIIRINALGSLTVIHMEVPCCSGLTLIAKEAAARSGTTLSFKDITIDLQRNMIPASNITKTEKID